MYDHLEYKGARFYKCALQVNSFNYKQKYQGAPPINKEEYNSQILEQCKRNKIEIVGLADHGNVEDSESLRELLRNNDIVVFPGFEIASSEKIHMVCLYQEHTTKSVLNQNLGQLMGQNSQKLEQEPTHPSSCSCEEIAKKVLNNQKGFWYAAHITGKNGLLRLSGSGDNYNHLWKKDDLVIAGQIPVTIDNLEQVGKKDLQQYKQIIENKNPAYKRKRRPIVIINAKDIRQPEDLKNLSASCLIKMTTPHFESFKQAFNDPKSRIRLNHQISEIPYSRIESVTWSGAGFFGEQKIVFSRNLNAIIGGRGTGKSTLIESIRYVLDLSPHKNDEDFRALEIFRKKTINNSQITLKIYSKTQQGNYYTISRRYGERPVIKKDDGEISHLSPREILPDIEILGQNEILEIEKKKAFQLELIHNFLPDATHFDEKIAESKNSLEKNRNKLIVANEEFERLDVHVKKEPAINEKILQFQKLGITDKLKNTELLENENKIKNRIKEQFTLIDNWVANYETIFDLEFLQDVSIEKLPSKEYITKIRENLKELKTALDRFVGQAGKNLQESKDHYEKINLEWEKNSNNVRDELNQAIAKLPEQAGKTGKELGREFTDNIKELTSIAQFKKTHTNQTKIIKQIELERETLLNEYRNTAFERFNALNKATKELNQNSLKNKLEISVDSCKNLDNFKEFLHSIEGIAKGKTEWLDSEGIEIDLLEWSKWIKESDKQAFKNKHNGASNGFIEKLFNISFKKRLMLEEIELEDTVNIKLNISHIDKTPNFQLLKDLSTGQKCTAILNLLLLNRNDPLIVDQPEDNLDNAFIAERIVVDLRKFKTKRQFLFATHNANIPVFGDAELIVVLDNNNLGKVKHIGSIDKTEVGQQAAEILEGGKQAFNMRKDKYGF